MQFSSHWSGIAPDAKEKRKLRYCRSALNRSRYESARCCDGRLGMLNKQIALRLEHRQYCKGSSQPRYGKRCRQNLWLTW